MKNLALLVFVYLLLASCSAQHFVRISKLVQKNCARDISNSNKETFHSVRSKLYKTGALNFIHSETDSVFILESYEFQTGRYIGRIWNKDGSVSYEYLRGIFNYRENLFYNYTIALVNRWDTIAIREEEKVNAESLPQTLITASRVVEIDGKVNVECLVFKSFFNLERDRWSGK